MEVCFLLFFFSWNEISGRISSHICGHFSSRINRNIIAQDDDGQNISHPTFHRYSFFDAFIYSTVCIFFFFSFLNYFRSFFLLITFNNKYHQNISHKVNLSKWFFVGSILKNKIKLDFYLEFDVLFWIVEMFVFFLFTFNEQVYSNAVFNSTFDIVNLSCSFNNKCKPIFLFVSTEIWIGFRHVVHKPLFIIVLDQMSDTSTHTHLYVDFCHV